MKETKIKTALGMRKFGKKVAQKCEKGTIIALCGSLGAGKSEFVRGFISYFDENEKVISPTFTYVQEYNLSSNNIYHFDLYRLSTAEEFMLVGGMEVLSKKDAIILIEWPDVIAEFLDKDRLVNISIKVEDDNSRLVVADGIEL